MAGVVDGCGGRKVRSVAQRKVSAVDLVLHEIRHAILTGQLPPGEPFTVPALTEQLGVSHVPVREALRKLEAQGLVVLSPSRSAIVTPLDPEDLRSIYWLRLRLEPELAALSAPRRSDDDLAELDALIQAVFDAEGERRMDLHREFHAAYLHPAASEWDFRLLVPLWDAAERYTRLVFDPVETSRETEADQHRVHDELVAAAHTRDPDLVENELRRHLERNKATMLERLCSVTPSRTRWLTGDTA